MRCAEEHGPTCLQVGRVCSGKKEEKLKGVRAWSLGLTFEKSPPPIYIWRKSRVTAGVTLARNSARPAARLLG